MRGKVLSFPEPRSPPPADPKWKCCPHGVALKPGEKGESKNCTICIKIKKSGWAKI